MKPKWNDSSPYHTFKYDAGGRKENISKTFTELGESVCQYRRHVRTSAIEYDVSWFVDTLIHFPATRRAYLNHEVISNMHPLAEESLFLPRQGKNNPPPTLRSPYPHCDYNDKYIDLPLLHFLWSMRKSRIYVFYLARYLGPCPEVAQDTAVSLLVKEPKRELILLSWLYWGFRKGTIRGGDFEEVMLEFKHAPHCRNFRAVERCKEVFEYVKFMLRMEYL